MLRKVIMLMKMVKKLRLTAGNNSNGGNGTGNTGLIRKPELFQKQTLPKSTKNICYKIRKDPEVRPVTGFLWGQVGQMAVMPESED